MGLVALGVVDAEHAIGVAAVDLDVLKRVNRVSAARSPLAFYGQERDEPPPYRSLLHRQHAAPLDPHHPLAATPRAHRLKDVLHPLSVDQLQPKLAVVERHAAEVVVLAVGVANGGAGLDADLEALPRVVPTPAGFAGTESCR